MTSIASTTSNRTPSGPTDWLRPPFWGAVGIVWAVFGVKFWADPTSLNMIFGDTDDAMRLVGVRDLLAGQGWRDLFQHRLDPAAPVPMHWSRLVDAPLAGLILLLQNVFAPPRAEALAMAIWPLLLMLPAFIGLGLIARRLGGSAAVLPTLILALLCPPFVTQFVPGRIDHHNIQISLTILAFAYAATPRAPWAAAVAGLLTAFALAVGVEALFLLVIPAAALAARYAMQRTDRGGLRAEMLAYGLAIGLVPGLLHLLLNPPGLWLKGACDALSANYVAGTLAGGIGLAFLSRWQGGETHPAWRWGGVALLGLAAATAFLAPETACWRGPSGQVDPALRPIWLNFINEMQPGLLLWQQSPAAFTVLVLLLGAGLGAGLWLIRQGGPRRRPALLLLLALIAATLATGAIVRVMVYAAALALPLLGAAIAIAARRAALRGASPRVVTLASLLLVNSTTVALVAMPLLPNGTNEIRIRGAGDQSGWEQCSTLSNYAPLGARPAGLVLGFIDSGPFVLAATHHATLSAPYHRHAHGIIAADRLLRTDGPDAAHALAAAGVDYIALCRESGYRHFYQERAPQGLASRLLAGETVPGLTPIPGNDAVLLFAVVPQRQTGIRSD